MVLDLVAEDLRVLRRLLDQRRGEIADSDLQQASLLLQLPHGPESLSKGHAIAGPVHQQEIDVFRAQLLQARFGLLLHTVVGEVARPDLGGQEDLLPLYPCILDAAPDLGLVAVHLGRIHVPVAHREGATDGPHTRLPGETVSAESQRGYLLTSYRLILHTRPPPGFLQRN